MKNSVLVYYLKEPTLIHFVRDISSSTIKASPYRQGGGDFYLSINQKTAKISCLKGVGSASRTMSEPLSGREVEIPNSLLLFLNYRYIVNEMSKYNLYIW